MCINHSILRNFYDNTYNFNFDNFSLILLYQT